MAERIETCARACRRRSKNVNASTPCADRIPHPPGRASKNSEPAQAVECRSTQYQASSGRNRQMMGSVATGGGSQRILNSASIKRARSRRRCCDSRKCKVRRSRPAERRGPLAVRPGSAGPIGSGHPRMRGGLRLRACSQCCEPQLCRDARSGAPLRGAPAIRPAPTRYNCRRCRRHRQQSHQERRNPPRPDRSVSCSSSPSSRLAIINDRSVAMVWCRETIRAVFPESAKAPLASRPLSGSGSNTDGTASPPRGQRRPGKSHRVA